MSLQDAFYVIGIVFMSLMLIIIVALVTAVFVIKAKITHIHRQIEEKLMAVTSLSEKVARTAKKVLNK
jgi:cell division protein FtsL